jgi:phage-related protein
LKFGEAGLPAIEQSFAPFQLEPVWRKELRDYLAERQAAHERHALTEPYHRVIERIAEAHSVDVEAVQAYFFQEFEKTPEYRILQHQGEVHG